MEIINGVETATSQAIMGGTIDNTVIGGTTAAAGTFTTLSADSIADLDSIALYDSNDSHSLTITWDENDTSARTLKLKVSTGSRTLTMTGDPTIADWFDQAVKAASSPTFAGVTLDNTGLHLLDTDASHDLIIKPGSDLTSADKTLTLTTGDSNRNITLSGDPTLSDWFDQDVKTTGSPTFTAVTETNGVLKQNLLTNSGFGVWSNSTLENVGTAVADDDAADDDTGDWTTANIETLAFDTDHYEIDSNGSGKMTLASIAFTAGKLYEISVEIKDGTASSETLTLVMNDGADQNSPTKTTTGSFVAATFVFEAATTTSSGTVGLDDISDTAASNIEVKTFTCYEVTPGCIAANALAQDGWYKKSGVQILRQHNDGGTLTKDGSFYSLKVDSISAGDNVIWPLSATKTLAEHYQKFAGRVITFGAWVYATTASHAFLQLVDSDTTDDDQTSDSSSYHTGGSSWEWLEVTMTVSATTTEFSAAICFDSTTTAYISQPMLVFGNSIGDGNYAPIPQEVIPIEQLFTLTNFNTTATSTIGTTTINLESESNLKIPKDIMAMDFSIRYGDSGSNAGNAIWNFQGYDDLNAFSFDIGTNGLELPSDNKFQAQARIFTNTNGDITHSLTATGSLTSDLYIRVNGVQLR